ncbi:MAG: hypothetical protein ACOC8N_09350, partial [Spirochaetota bacterium]
MRTLIVVLIVAVAAFAAAGDVAIIEDHGEALSLWAAAGVRGMKVIHFDAHADLQPVPPAAVARLNLLMEQGDWEGLAAANHAGEGGLYHCGDFLYAAHA